MNSNKFYCRNGTQATAPNSSMSSATPSALGFGGSSFQDYIGCSSVNSSSDFPCKELLPRNGNSKAVLNQHGSTGVTSYSAGNSTSGYCSSNSSVTGNYINVMPVSMGSLQYHRRKIPTQEYQQPRLYYNTTDYRSRDDYYSIGSVGVGCVSGNGRLNTSSPSPSLQNQHQNQLSQNNTIISHQPNQLSQHQHHKQQQQHQNSHHQQQHTHLQSQQHQYQQQNQLHPIHRTHNQHQSICNPDTANESIEESTQLSAGGTYCRTLQEGHSHHSFSNAVGEQEIVPTTASTIGTINVPGPPLMYTVHRVVTTAQIQTATGNTYASSSSISSVVSAVRNETDCTPEPVASKNSPGCSINGTALSSVNILADNKNSYINQNAFNGNNIIGGCSSGPTTVTNHRNSPGMSTSYLSHQPKCNIISEDQQHGSVRTSNNNYTNSSSATNASYITGVKSSSLISRPLQNVIPTCVYLMSRVAVHMEIEGTAQCPAQVMLAAALGCEELGIANKLLAQSIFGLWMTSALLEIQLKSHHRPFVVRVAWKNLLEKFSRCNPIEIKFDEPMIILKRNVFFSKKDEEKIKDHRILELLYEEAKHNVLSGRYVMEPVHSLMLGGIQARIELGPFNSNSHTISFFRENQSRFLPPHVAKSSSWSWLPVSRKNSAEVKLLEQFKRVPQTATTRKLMRKYLEFCWALPFYGSAYFHGQVEQPVRGVMSLVNHKDVDVLIAVNERGVFIIDSNECTLLLGLKYEDLLWDFAKPSANDDPECLTCIFLQFDAFENGIQMSKLMQIFSKQAPMIDALISHFAEQMRKRKLDGHLTDQYHDEPNPIQNNGNGVLCNKLSRLTLATFDEEGRCIGQTGSLSISY